MSQQPTRPSWRDVLPAAMTEFKLCMEFGQLPVTPFSYFVTPEQSPHAHPGPKIFHYFMKLPVEIQRLIFQSCDIPTRFRLLQTSSYTRHLCWELFWDEPEHNVWYHLGMRMGNLLNTRVITQCPEFAARVTQVEMDLDSLQRWEWPEYTFSNFWEKVKKNFPAVRAVVMKRRPPPPGEFNPDFSSLAELVAAAPQDITVFVASPYPDFEGCLLHRLWRINAAEACWAIVEDRWRPMRVLFPHRKVPIRPLGDLISLFRMMLLKSMEERGLHWLIEETCLCYRDTMEIECPRAGCSRRYDDSDAKGMKWHARLDQHEAVGSAGQKIRSKMTAHRNTPTEVKVLLDKKQRRCDEMEAAFKALLEKLRAQYGEYGKAGHQRAKREMAEHQRGKLRTAKHHQFEDTVAAQMKEYGYLAPEQSLHDSNIWRTFLYHLDKKN